MLTRQIVVYGPSHRGPLRSGVKSHGPINGEVNVQLYLVCEKSPLLLPISIAVALADEVNTTEPFPTLSKTALSTSETTSEALRLQFREVYEQCVGTLSVAGPLVRMQEERFLSELSEQFIHTASEIELSLPYP